MIQRLTVENKIDVYDFLSRVEDRHQDFYLTEDKSRKFLKNDWSLITKVLLKQEVYGLENNGIKAIMIIVRDKGFRPYVKLLAENSKYTIDMLKFLKWSYFEKDLYFKLKKNNPLSQIIKKTGFIKIGDRGLEDLFFKKGLKQLFKITPKDLYLVDEENRLY
jgi:site-specific recombinase XerC